MGKLPTYGMAGIGIAAAIGFVFALSIFSANSGIINLEQSRQEKTNEPTGQGAGNNGPAPLFSKSTDQPASPQENLSSNQQVQSSLDLRPTLESILATDRSRLISSEISPGMEFEVHKPVLMQAKFANQNDGLVKNHTISLSIRSGAVDYSNSSETTEQGQYDQAAYFRGDIAAQSGIELELCWNPDTPGDYTISLSSNTPLDLASPEPTKPVATIPVKVVAAL
ncbi:MAG: hypothetical protein AUJ08_08240 [Thaumarchaeota archaeon 13_1_40CM_3_50_5]|nr:MAG: hypothetical protein AUH71_00415 [Thaumarchaeota archaeon 13_1_40CM_4_48_7]OLC80715.1 MAG: hypothetical protein AUJ08_08240 [Thaumarchaeota archaeon 13_1_40CM_3_50_5]